MPELPNPLRPAELPHLSLPPQSNALNVAFVITGALLGERALDSAVNSAWRRHNAGRLYEDNLGTSIGVMDMSEDGASPCFHLSPSLPQPPPTLPPLSRLRGGMISLCSLLRWLPLELDTQLWSATPALR
jgi:hypothetical protein